MVGELTPRSREARERCLRHPFRRGRLKSSRTSVYLDYAQPKNPWFIAKIRDEIREVAEGLWLGPAMWKTGARSAAHVLWFTVDFHTPAR